MIAESIAHWKKLGDEAEAKAVYQEGRGQYGGVQRNQAALFRRTATSLEKEVETGVWHCVCCLKPHGCSVQPKGARE